MQPSGVENSIEGNAPLTASLLYSVAPQLNPRHKTWREADGRAEPRCAAPEVACVPSLGTGFKFQFLHLWQVGRQVD